MFWKKIDGSSFEKMKNLLSEESMTLFGGKIKKLLLGKFRKLTGGKIKELCLEKTADLL